MLTLTGSDCATIHDFPGIIRGGGGPIQGPGSSNQPTDAQSMVSDGTVPYKTHLALPGLILTPPWTRDKTGRGQKQNNFRFLNPIISGSNHIIELLTWSDKRSK